MGDVFMRLTSKEVKNKNKGKELDNEMCENDCAFYIFNVRPAGNEWILLLAPF